jgi:hypothetical protein
MAIQKKVEDLEHQSKQARIKESKDQNKITEKTIQNLQIFKAEVEKNLKQAFWKNKEELQSKPEEIGRSQLDAYIKGLGAKHIALDARAGKGKSDLVAILVDDNLQLAETKIWYNDKYVLDEGIKKLEGYMEAEEQKVGYYVVYDPRPNQKIPPSILKNQLLGRKNIYKLILQEGKEIYLIHIDIAD